MKTDIRDIQTTNIDDPLIMNKEFKSSFDIFYGTGYKFSYSIYGSIIPYKSKYLEIKFNCAKPKKSKNSYKLYGNYVLIYFKYESI